MISDVLFEGVDGIEEYERDLPTVYADMQGELHAVKTVMNGMRAILDSPKTDARNELQRAIAELPIERLTAALNRFRLRPFDAIPDDLGHAKAELQDAVAR